MSDNDEHFEDGYGDDASGDEEPLAARVILWLALPVAAAALVVSGALLLADSRTAHVVGWALSSLVAFILVSVHRRLAVVAAARRGILLPRRQAVQTTVLLSAGFVIAVAHAWPFARSFG